MASGVVGSNSTSEDSYSDVERSPGPPLPKRRGQLFPRRTTEILEGLYARGMNGWGKSHTSQIEEALDLTGLELSKIIARSAIYKM